MKVPHLWLAACVFGSLSTLGATAPELEVLPRNPLLFGNASEQRLLVLARHSDGRLEDVTAEARFRSANPSVAVVSPAGVVAGQAFGGARIEVSYRGARASTTALVQRTDRPAPVSFGGDVMPLLTKMGCSGGNCHGAITGQNGFKLSLFGYHPDEDYAMIAEKHEGPPHRFGQSGQQLVAAQANAPRSAWRGVGFSQGLGRIPHDPGVGRSRGAA